METLSTRVERLRRAHRVAQAQGSRIGEQQKRAKLRVFQQVRNLPVSDNKDVVGCRCKDRPEHLHTFGGVSVIPLPAAPESVDLFALYAARCRDFRKRGSAMAEPMRTHENGKPRKTRTALQAVHMETVRADAVHKARAIIDSEHTSERSKRRAAIVLGVKRTPMAPAAPDLAARALRRRRRARAAK